MTPNIKDFIESLRRRWQQPTSLTYDEFRQLRMQHAVSLIECCHLLDVSADALFNAETQGSYVDGGVRSTLDQMFGPVKTTDLLAETVERIKQLDPSAPHLKTWSQKVMAALDVYVETAGITDFTTKHRDPKSKIPDEVKDAMMSHLGLQKRHLVEGWLLYRHVKLGTRPQLAMRMVVSGQQQASTALAEYDEHGYRAVVDRKKRPRRRAPSSSKVVVDLDLVDSSESKPEKQKKTRSSARLRSSRRAREASEAAESLVGTMLVQLRAIVAENNNDADLIKLIEGITSNVEPIHHRLKRLVLQRAAPVKKRKRPTNPKDSDHA